MSLRAKEHLQQLIVGTDEEGCWISNIRFKLETALGKNQSSPKHEQTIVGCKRNGNTGEKKMLSKLQTNISG